MMSTSIENPSPRIQVLPEDMANKIAAGEVIERPASVVKELMENAIDARATQISVEIQGAGKELIRVTDNGEGMSPDDAKRAFSRHATSKISTLDDLDGISTLGFRGEALPSIASVAKVRMVTARDETAGGAEIVVETGSLKTVKTIARPRGTTVEVQKIFYNTPARKKFLKRDSTETSHIIQGVTQQALANPHIHFTLSHNGRRIINALATDHALYRVAEILGTELTEELVRVESDNGRYRLEGFVSNPVFTRSNASYQYFYVNHRYIRDKVIMHATQQAYSHLLPKEKYPVLVLMLSMKAHLVDVNVHPAKAEVRFAFQQEVHQFVSKSIKNALSQSVLLNKGSFSKGEVVGPEEVSNQSSGSSYNLSGTPLSRLMSSAEMESDAIRPSPFSRPSTDSLKVSGREAVDLLFGGDYPDKKGQQDPHLKTPFETLGRKPVPVANLIYSEYEPLGQLENSFIILQGKGGILVVDQHIAHERILYERFREAAKTRTIESQQLLFPVSLDVSPNEAQLLSSQIDTLKSLGLGLEPFGNHSFLVRTLPAILKNDDPAVLVRDIAEELKQHEKTHSVQEKYEEMVIMMSCRKAIKVNHPMGMEQIRKLLYDLEQTEMPFTCPHGRPIALLIEMDSILRKFLRK